MLGKITYKGSSPYRLGNEPVSLGRFEQITKDINAGELIGLPVYAYVHSGETISTQPFTCPFDSGRSGWVYCTLKAALKFGAGKDDPLEFAREQLRKDVKWFDETVLNGSEEMEEE